MNGNADRHDPARARAIVPGPASFPRGASGRRQGGQRKIGKNGIGKSVAKAARRRRRRTFFTAVAVILVLLAGAGAVIGTWVFDDAQLSEPKAEDQVTLLLPSDGKPLAQIGEQNRELVPYQRINPVIGEAVMAAEDKHFLTHHGIGMRGILRAAWNNFTGGRRQGASTITQQYARHAADLKAISINRKLREAVIARKLESQYDKNQIMGMYLNYVDFGEGRYGIEAAAQGYFGKSVTTPAGQKNAITPYEAAVLASIIKQPYPTKSYGGYDPNYNKAGAQERWEYTM